MPRLYVTHPLEGVQDRRQLLKISAGFIAAAIGLETPSFRRLERGERRCYLDKAIIIADLLGCSLLDLGVIPSGDARTALLIQGDAKKVHARVPPIVVPLEPWQNSDGSVNEGYDDDDGGPLPVEPVVPAPKLIAPAPAAPTVKPVNASPTEEPELSLAELIANFGDDDDPVDFVNNGLVVLPTPTANDHEDDDIDPDLPVDPMAKYVSTWTGEV